jgi:protein-arginine kinase activator protein McsA
MDIQCYECNKNMGTIRDAKLRKGWVMLCKECRESPNYNQDNTIRASSQEDFNNQMSDMFGFDMKNNPFNK